MEGLDGVPVGASVEGGRRDSLTRWHFGTMSGLGVELPKCRFATSHHLCLQEQSTLEKCSWDLAQYTGGEITNCLKSLICLVWQQRTWFLSHYSGAGKSWELEGFWKQSRAEMGKRNHNRLLQQVSPPPHHPHHVVDQDRGGVAAGSNGEDPDNNGQTESNARRPQSVNSLFFLSN